MSKQQYRATGQPAWWARIGSGEDAEYLRLPLVRGDQYLDVTVDVPRGTREITIGCGPNNEFGIREVVKIG